MSNLYYNAETGKFDLSAIMRDAWNGMARNQIRVRLALRLGVIWATAKAEKAASLKTAEQNAADSLNAQATIIELKTRISERDMARAVNLRRQARQMTQISTIAAE